MALHSELPIHKRGCELLALALRAQEQMPRGVKRTLGERVASYCVEMLDLMAMANATKHAERAGHIRKVLQCQRALTVLLRVSHDSRYISTKLWSQSVQLLDSIGSQAGGWLKSAQRTQAPAA
jgi:hypothetical protein